MKKKIVTLIVVSIFLILSIVNVNASNLTNIKNKEQEPKDLCDTQLKSQSYSKSETFRDAKLQIFLDGKNPLSLIDITGGGTANLKIKNKLSKVPTLTPIIVSLIKFFDKRGIETDFPSIPSVFRTKFDMTIEFIKEANEEKTLFYGTSIENYNREELFDLKNEKHKIEFTHKRVNPDNVHSMVDNCVATCWWYEWLIDYEVPRSIIFMECEEITVYYN